MFLSKEREGSLQALSHNCLIDSGKTGICGVRANRKGKLFSEIYGEVTSIAVDPIEKKPLYHFHPGTPILSAGTKGCNFMCSFCQNWNISQDVNARSEYYSPEDLINLAISRRSHGVAYTYSEPMIWFEYVLDCAMLAHRKGLYNVLVTNGYVNPAPLDELLAHVDAMNIDLKSFRSATYRKVQKGGLDDVLATIRTASKRCHVELTTLVVTGINDDIGEIATSSAGSPNLTEAFPGTFRATIRAINMTPPRPISISC
jgi:pyruvate formate lyase activating enzyme